MTGTTVRPRVLNVNDYFLVQRENSLGNGSSSMSTYRVSAEDIAIFSADRYDTVMGGLVDDFEDIQNQLDMINNQLLTTIKEITTNHDIRIKVVEDITQELIYDVNETNVRIDDALAKTKQFFYHQLQDAVQTSAPGEMIVKKADGGAVDNLSEVEAIEYFLEPTQNFANLFLGETLELTSQRGISGEDAYFAHRAIYKITEKISLGGDRIEIRVTHRHSSGDGIPYYQTGLNNLVRTDVYLIFTITEDEYKEGIDSCYKTTGGEISGDVIIKKGGTTKLTFDSDIGEIAFNETLRFKRSGSQVMTLLSNEIQLKKTTNLSNQRITNLGAPSGANDAATRGYVDNLISVNDVTEDDLYTAGEAVVADAAAKAEPMGFFFVSGSLYLKTR